MARWWLLDRDDDRSGDEMCSVCPTPHAWEDDDS